MAPLSRKASWRRADPVVARSDGFGATAVSSVSKQQGSSLAGQNASSSLDNPVSPVIPSVPSPASDSIPTSTTLPTTPAVISTASSPVTSIGTLLQPPDSASSLANVQSTTSDFLSSPVSTISHSDPTTFMVSSSPVLFSSLPTITTGSMAASTTPDILDVMSPTSSAVQDTQTPPTDIPSSAPYATSLISNTRSPLAPTTTLSSQPSQLTQTPLPSDEVLSPSGASPPATSTDIFLPTSSVATSTGSETGVDPSHIPKLSSEQSSSGLPGGNVLGTSGVKGPTEVLVAPSSAISTSGVLLTATTTTDQTQTTATLNITATTTSTSLPNNAPTPASSSTEALTTTDGNFVEPLTTSPGVSASTSEVTDATSISSTVTIASSPVTESLSSSTDATPTTATPSDTLPSDGGVFTFSAPFTSATSLGSATITIPATIPTNTPSAIALADSSSTHGPGNFNAVKDDTSLTESSFVVGSAEVISLVTSSTTVVAPSFVEVSGTSSLIFVTTTSQIVVPTAVPVSPGPPKRSPSIAAIAVPTSVAVVLILVLVSLFYRRRKHVRRASHQPFDFSRTLEVHEESMPQSELPTFPTLLPTQGPRGWNDPPTPPFASMGPAKDPFADPVSINAFRPSAEPFSTQSIRRVSMADPFADPPVVMFSSQGESPSRLSKASWYDERDARASVPFNNVGRAV